MLVALIASQMLAYGPPPECRCQCDCPQPRYERPHEEIRLNDSFFIGEGGVGPAFSPPVYSGGYIVFDGGGSGFSSSSSFARAGASASASASASANVRVRVIGGGGGYRPSKPGGGHHGGKGGY